MQSLYVKEEVNAYKLHIPRISYLLLNLFDNRPLLFHSFDTGYKIQSTNLYWAQLTYFKFIIL